MRSSSHWTNSAAIALVVLTAAAPAHGLPRRLPPIDQCSADRSFTKFTDELRGIAKRQDSRAFVALFAPEAKKPTGYGGDVDPNDVMPVENWLSFETVLRMGCVRSGKTFVMPSVSAQTKRFAAASLENKAVVLRGAEFFEFVAGDRVPAGKLDWEVVTVTNMSGDFFYGVRLPDGRNGWVGDYDLYFLDPRYGYSEIRFEKRNGRWMITHFWYP
jgi:hypothetical protein